MDGLPLSGSDVDVDDDDVYESLLFCHESSPHSHIRFPIIRLIPHLPRLDTLMPNEHEGENPR